MPISQLLTKRTVEGSDQIKVAEVLSLLELDCVHLPPKAKTLIERVSDVQVRWEQFHTFYKQYRPFTLGVLQEKDCEPHHHWDHMGKSPYVCQSSWIPSLPILPPGRSKFTLVVSAGLTALVFHIRKSLKELAEERSYCSAAGLWNYALCLT